MIAAASVEAWEEAMRLYAKTGEVVDVYAWPDGPCNVRLKERDGSKTFRWMAKNGGGFTMGRDEAHKPFAGWTLYRHESLDRPGPAFVVEGEKDCDALVALGVPCVTSGGTSTEAGANWSGLAGRDVVLWPDNDPVGKRFMERVAEKLRGVAASVRVIDPATLGLPEKGDASDWLQLHPGAKAQDVLALPMADRAKDDKKNSKLDRVPAASTGFTLQALGELMKRPDVPVIYVVDGMLEEGTCSMVVAKPKVGKSTLSRNCALAVSRGEPFLGRATRKGEVIYLALEERVENIKADFIRMGAKGSEPILIHASHAPEAAIVELVMLIKERRPRLVVVDPLFRIAPIKDEKAYAETYQALGPLIDIARETNCHVMLDHHAGKSAKFDAIDTPLGSTALGGIPHTLIHLNRHENYRTIQTVQRTGEDLPPTLLNFDPETKTLSLGGPKAEAERTLAEQRILNFLKTADKPQTQAEIRSGVEGQGQVIRAALTALAKAERVGISGSGKRGDPFRYLFHVSGSPYTVGTSKPETSDIDETPITIEEKVVPSFLYKEGTRKPETAEPTPACTGMEQLVVPVSSGKAEGGSPILSFPGSTSNGTGRAAGHAEDGRSKRKGQGGYL